MTQPSEGPTLLVSSAPLGWPDIIVERRVFAKLSRIDQPRGVDAHRIIVWDEAISCRVVIGGRRYDFDPTTPCQVTVPAFVSFEAQPKSPVRFTKLLLEPDFVETLARVVFGRSVSLRAGVAPCVPAIAAVASLLSDAATGHQPMAPLVVQLLAREATLLSLDANATVDQIRDPKSLTFKPGRLATVLAYIATHLQEPLTVDRLAREAGLSRSQFSRAFGAAVGATPHAFVMAQRGSRAAMLLTRSKRSIGQIAVDCGFHDQAHLTRVFRSLYGATPRQVRDGGLKP